MASMALDALRNNMGDRSADAPTPPAATPALETAAPNVPAGAPATMPPAEPAVSTATVPDPPPATEPPAVTLATDSTPPAEPNAVDDAALLDMLRKRTGRADLASIDDLLKPAAAAPATEPTDEERTKQAQQFRNDSLRYGLDKGLYDASTLETFHVEKARPAHEVALSSFREAALESDPDLKERYKTDKAGVNEEIKDMFEDRFALNEEPTSLRYKMGQREIGNIADNYLNSKYGVILGAEDAFTQELDTRQRATTYKTTMDKVIAAQSDRLEAIVDGKTFGFTIPESIRTDVKNQMLLPASFEAFGSAELNEAAITSAYNQAVFNKVWPALLAESAKAYHAEMVKDQKLGRLHAPVTTEENGSNMNGNLSSGTGSKALNQMKGNMRQQPA